MPIIDALHQEININNPKRVISLVPSLTETLFSFRLDNKIIGVTKYCIFPKHAPSFPRVICGGTKNPDIDLIVSLKPDLIIANKEENQEKHVQKLISLGIPVWVTYPLTINDSIRIMEQIIEIFDLKSEKSAVAFLQTLKKRVETVSNKILVSKMHANKVFVPIWKNPWMSINKDTYIQSVLSFLGLNNVTSQLEYSRYPKVNLTKIIINQKPDIILLPTEPYLFSENDILEIYEVYDQLNLPRIKKIHIIDGTYLSWYGSRIPEALEYLYSLLYNNE